MDSHWLVRKPLRPPVRSGGAVIPFSTMNRSLPKALLQGLPARAEVAVSSPAACILCPLAEASSHLCHWPHRCVFSGDGIQAWLVGVTHSSLPIALFIDASLTLIVTFGEADVTCLGIAHHLLHGQSFAIPAATAVKVHTHAQADLLLLMTAV